MVKQPQVALHHHKVLHLLRIQLDPLGLDALFFGTTLFFWTGGVAVGDRDKYVLIIFQFFLNII